jgi:hypothetical protein
MRARASRQVGRGAGLHRRRRPVSVPLRDPDCPSRAVLAREPGSTTRAPRRVSTRYAEDRFATAPVCARALEARDGACRAACCLDVFSPALERRPSVARNDVPIPSPGGPERAASRARPGRRPAARAVPMQPAVWSKARARAREARRVRLLQVVPRHPDSKRAERATGRRSPGRRSSSGFRDGDRARPVPAHRWARRSPQDRPRAPRLRAPRRTSRGARV